jgi:hypothetical protein
VTPSIVSRPLAVVVDGTTASDRAFTSTRTATVLGHSRSPSNITIRCGVIAVAVSG